MLAMALVTVGVRRAVTENRAPARRQALMMADADDVVAVVGRIRAHDHQPGGARAPGGGQRIGQQLRRTPHGVGGAVAQSGGGDQRRRQRGRQHHEQGVEALHPGVAAPGTLLGVAIGLAHSVVDVDEHQPVGAGQQRGHRRQPSHQAGGHGVELADVTEGEPAQEGAQCGRGAGLLEQPRHAAMAQQVHVADRVRARDHARDQSGDLRGRVRAALPGQRETLDQQRRQSAPGRERHHRHQPGA
jgi:hypothetical protein